ncbi:MAG: hypothetical protein ACJA1A_003534 [Saprospiraceae bacterium]|jgi:hypothetical protein
MEKLLRKLKLKDDFRITIPIMKSDFVNKLRRNMDEGSTSSFFPITEVFSSSKKNYIGSISGNEFELRKRLRFFDTNKGGAIAKGSMSQEGENLNIDICVNGFKNFFIFYFILITLFYVFFFGTMMLGLSQESDGLGLPVFVVPFLLLHGAMMYGVPIFIARRGVKNIKNDLEKDFFYFTK